MTKGTAALGQRGKAKLHIKCRRCGKNSYHKKTGICSHCGYGRTKKIRNYSWKKKHHLKRLNNVKGFRRRVK